MRKILIDTQVLIWWISGNIKLKKGHLNLLEDNSLDICISKASLFEIYIKVNLGKLEIPPNLEGILNKIKVNLLGLEFDHFVDLVRLPLCHRDPIDRMIIATAIAENIELISYDNNFRDYAIRLI